MTIGKLGNRIRKCFDLQTKPSRNSTMAYYFNNLICLALVLFVFVKSFECSEDVCEKRSPCKCVFPNGTGIDLTPTMSTSPLFYTTNVYQSTKNGTEYKLSTYSFHPCADVLMAKGDTCNQPLSLYREVSTLIETQTRGVFNQTSSLCEYLGKTELVGFSNDGRSLIYQNPPSNTTVLLSCAQGDTQLHMFSSMEPGDILLSFYSKYACLQQLEEPGRSFGSTLLIIFFSFLIFYLVLGVCTKKFLMGATGIEVIPNLAFWSDLPNLVKDGWAFAISGFKLPPRGVGATSPDPNSYDSI